MQTTIIIPAFNEEKNLEKLLPEWVNVCNKENYKLIIINDGSTDNTREILKQFEAEAEIKILHHKINKGYGASIKTGILSAESTYIATMDADGQHNLEDIKTLVRYLISENADMVIGKRINNIDTFFRRIGKWIILKFAKFLLPIKITDINSGMKVYNTGIAKKVIRICPDNMSYNIIPLIFINQGHKVLEHPITINKRLSGASKVKSTAGIDIMMEIIHIVSLFNPMRIFLPASLFCLFAGIAWGLPIIIRGDGVSVGSMLGIVTRIIIFFMGLIAEQLAAIRKERLE